MAEVDPIRLGTQLGAGKEAAASHIAARPTNPAPATSPSRSRSGGVPLGFPRFLGGSVIWLQQVKPGCQRTFYGKYGSSCSSGVRTVRADCLDWLLIAGEGI